MFIYQITETEVIAGDRSDFLKLQGILMSLICRTKQALA